MKNYGFGAGQPKDAGAVPEATFGRASRWDEWDAVRLIRGDYTQEEQVWAGMPGARSWGFAHECARARACAHN